jgi:hypothetical protein
MVKMMLPTLDKEVEAYYEVEKVRAENPPNVGQKTIVCSSRSSLGKGEQDGENILSASINCQSLPEESEKNSDDS